MERAPGETRPPDVAGRLAVVVGAARSGIAAAQLLAARGAQVVLTDLREAVDGTAGLAAQGITLELGAHRRETFLRADLVVLSPGVPPSQGDVAAARAAGVPVIGELELAWRFLRGPVVAVTGTKGKSTTTTLLGRMVSEGGKTALVGGNIGVALSSLVAETSPDAWHVIEVSSFQLETAETFRPDIAVFLNLSADHLDRHASFEDYAQAKARIFAHQRPDDWALINGDDAQVAALAASGRARMARFSTRTRYAPGVAIVDGTIVWVDDDETTTALALVSSIQLIGVHLVSDVLAAAGAAHLCGVAPAAIQRALEQFTGIEHALERVGEVRGVQFVNDSKATNVDAAGRAIESFDGGLVVIMGGRFKGGDLATLVPALRERAVAVVAIGEAAPLLHAAFDGHVRVDDAGSMRDAVAHAFALAPAGGTVLLAPACASFDQFRDYANRGRAFKEAVASLVE